MNIIRDKAVKDIPNGWTVKTTIYGTSRIKATCQRDSNTKWSKIVPYDYSLSGVAPHVKAVHALINSGKWFYQNLEHDHTWEIISWGSDWAGYTFIVVMTSVS